MFGGRRVGQKRRLVPHFRSNACAEPRFFGLCAEQGPDKACEAESCDHRVLLTEKTVGGLRYFARPVNNALGGRRRVGNPAHSVSARISTRSASLVTVYNAAPQHNFIKIS